MATCTHSIEGVCLLWKRTIVRTLHKMKVRHVVRFLEEPEWPFNSRNNPLVFRDTLAHDHEHREPDPTGPGCAVKLHAQLPC